MSEVKEIALRAQAFQAGAEAATLLAVRHGASDLQVAARLEQVHGGLARQGRETCEHDQLARARYTLRCRREICRAMAGLALEAGVPADELTSTMTTMMQASTQLAEVTTVADLGFDN